METIAEPAVRERTFAWEDPRIPAAAAPRMSGLEFLEGIRDGRVPPPPVAMALGMEIHEIEAGRVVFGLEPREFHYNPIGSVHGGVLATLLDTAIGCAVHSQLPAGSGYTTLELKINYLRPVSVESGALACEGRVLHAGGRTALAEGRITDRKGRLVAFATSTCMVFRGEQG
jgi:uncharacterized protein (TIGR00369 family)